jgi:hypothetical protein
MDIASITAHPTQNTVRVGFPTMSVTTPGIARKSI